MPESGKQELDLVMLGGELIDPGLAGSADAMWASSSTEPSRPNSNNVASHPSGPRRATLVPERYGFARSALDVRGARLRQSPALQARNIVVRRLRRRFVKI